MDVENEFLQRIVKYLNDPTDEAVRAEVENWRGQSIANERYFLDVERIWNSSSELALYPTLDISQATQRLAHRLAMTDRFRDNSNSASPFTWFLRAAAVLAVFAVAWWSINKMTNARYLTVTTLGKMDSVKIADGSQVFLDANTTLLYPDKIKGDERKVYLTKGNAFFDVAKDARRPFVIDLGNSRVTVLGTSFNILLTEKEIEVSVTEGTVLFSKGESSKDATRIQAGEGIVYHRNSGLVDQIDATNSNADSWLTRHLNFKDASLDEVLASIEKMYKVDIRLEDSIANFKKFNADFSGDDLQEVLEILEATYPIDIQQRDSLLIIKSNTSRK